MINQSIPIEQILNESLTLLESDWTEMNNQTIRNIDNLEDEIIFLEGEKKPENVVKINDLRKKIKTMLADDEEEFEKIKLNVYEAAKNELVEKNIYSNKEMGNILYIFNMYAFDKNYSESYNLKPFKEILQIAISLMKICNSQ